MRTEQAIARMDALREAILDNLECLEVAAAELSTTMTYAIGQFYTEKVARAEGTAP